MNDQAEREHLLNLQKELALDAERDYVFKPVYKASAAARRYEDSLLDEEDLIQMKKGVYGFLGSLKIPRENIRNEIFSALTEDEIRKLDKFGSILLPRIKNLKISSVDEFRAILERFDKLLRETGDTGIEIAAQPGEYDEKIEEITRTLRVLEPPEDFIERVTKLTDREINRELFEGIMGLKLINVNDYNSFMTEAKIDEMEFVPVFKSKGSNPEVFAWLLATNNMKLEALFKLRFGRDPPEEAILWKGEKSTDLSVVLKSAASRGGNKKAKLITDTDMAANIKAAYSFSEDEDGDPLALLVKDLTPITKYSAEIAVERILPDGTYDSDIIKIGGKNALSNKHGAARNTTKIKLGRGWVDMHKLPTRLHYTYQCGRSIMNKIITAPLGKAIASYMRNGKLTMGDMKEMTQSDIDEFSDFMRITRLPAEEILRITGTGMYNENAHERLQEYERLRKAILAGNTNRDLLKKFKMLMLDLNSDRLLNRREVDDVLQLILSLE